MASIGNTGYPVIEPNQKKMKKRPGRLEIVLPANGSSPSDVIKPADSELMMFQFLWNFITIASNVVTKTDHGVRNLQSQGITHILNVTNEPFPEAVTKATGIEKMQIPINDVGIVDLIRCFSRVFRFIDSAKNTPNGKILVHCQAGISRSVSMVMAYLIWNNYNDFESCDDVLRLVRTIRPIADPNAGFGIQLDKFLKVKKNMPNAASVDVFEQTKIELC